MQIQISWLPKKPTDLDLHCLLKHSMSFLVREGLTHLQLVDFYYNSLDQSISYSRVSAVVFIPSKMISHVIMDNSRQFSLEWPQLEAVPLSTYRQYFGSEIKFIF